MTGSGAGAGPAQTLATPNDATIAVVLDRKPIFDDFGPRWIVRERSIKPSSAADCGSRVKTVGKAQRSSAARLDLHRELGLCWRNQNDLQHVIGFLVRLVQPPSLAAVYNCPIRDTPENRTAATASQNIGHGKRHLDPKRREVDRSSRSLWE